MLYFYMCSGGPNAHFPGQFRRSFLGLEMVSGKETLFPWKHCFPWEHLFINFFFFRGKSRYKKIKLCAAGAFFGKNEPKNGFLERSGARPLCIKLFGVHACPAGPISCPAGENFANQGPFPHRILKGTLHPGRDPGRLKPGFWSTFF